MKNIKHTLFLMLIIFSVFIADINAATFFSGNAGGKINFGSNPNESKYDPDMKLQAFFAGQFSLSNNMWAHTEFSIDTDDFISSSIFSETPSMFQIDELSFTTRNTFSLGINYFSAYMGTYDPIGSDIFLQRYIGIAPINSKLTESYLGLAGSILYPHFGFGVSDIVKLYDQPFTFGGYVYLNKEKQISEIAANNASNNGASKNKDIFVLNTDLRFACVLRYFICDLAFGIGAPVGNNKQYEGLVIAIDKLYWHIGGSILVGNNYTTSLFLQTGFNGAFTNPPTPPEKMYLILEPRFIIGDFNLNVSLFNLPKDTVKQLLILDDGLGIDVNFYNEKFNFGSNPRTFSMGGHICFSIKNRTVFDFGKQKFFEDGISINITPYISTEFAGGEVHAQIAIKAMEFAKSFGKAFSFDIGYKKQF